MSYVILIHGLVDGQQSPYDESYLASFNFVGCEPGEANLETVADPYEAKQFGELTEATEFWRQIDPREPMRWYDDEPNRPLTVFSISIESVP